MLSSDGSIRWTGAPVGKLIAGDDVLRPRLRIIADEQLTGASREAVQTRLNLWLVNHIERLRLYPWTPAAVRKLNQAGLLAIVVTNQSGVGQGYFPEELVHRVHERIGQELAANEARLDALYYCPHHPIARLESYRQECRCRKPGPGMVEQSGVELDPRSNIRANTIDYRTSLPKLFAAGDMRRGQSLVVWAIREGRQCARAIDEYLMGTSLLPR